MNDNDLTIEFTTQTPCPHADIDALTQLARSVIKKFYSGKADVSIALVDDDGIAQVHKDFLNDERTTDVISFDLSDDLDDCRTFELVVNVQMAERQAQKRGHSPLAEIALYITHGLLHNLGFDDIDEDDAAKMHAMEDCILRDTGFGTVYAANKIEENE